MASSTEARNYGRSMFDDDFELNDLNPDDRTSVIDSIRNIKQEDKRLTFYDRKLNTIVTEVRDLRKTVAA